MLVFFRLRIVFLDSSSTCDLIYIKYPGLERTDKVVKANKDFSLISAPKRRFQIYQWMLDHMSSKQKWDLLHDIVKKALEPFIFDSLAQSGGMGEKRVEMPKHVSDPAGQMLLDCFKILASSAMKTSFRKTAGPEGDEEGGGGGGSAVEQAQALEAAVLDKAKQKMACEELLPTLLLLKKCLEKARLTALLVDLEKTILAIASDFEEHLVNLPLDDQQTLKDIQDMHEMQRDTQRCKNN